MKQIKKKKRLVENVVESVKNIASLKGYLSKENV